jgi:signal transduction histidine kinase/CheY-like chemotaxis protein
LRLATLPWTEEERLRALHGYGILDTPPEEAYDDIVQVVCDSLDAPIAAINLIAEHRQWFKAEIGLNVREMELDNSICAKAILQSDFFVVPDTTKDPRFACNPLVTGAPGLRFYAGALLKTEEGFPIGTLCALDIKPRPDGITAQQALLMKTLARMVMTTLEQGRLARRQSEALNHEIAERLQIEEALRQSQKLEAIGQLTGGVAHDFNNLLTVIRGSIDLLRRPELPEEKRRRYLDAISDTADRAASLTSQLLAYARRQPLKAEVFDAAEQIKAIADMLKTTLGSRIRIDFDVGNGWQVKADPNQFETALLNLVVNARDAMTGGGLVKVAIEPRTGIPALRSHRAVTGDFLAVSVEDTGEGIPGDLLDDIFAPFFTTKRPGQGTGLGLSQVIGFAKQSGGDVAVESTIGRGTRFTLFLPRSQDMPARSSDDEVMAKVSGRRGRILVVEDNDVVARFATEGLTDLGYTCETAPNAEAALGLLDDRASRFDAIFSDVVMPGMSGIEFAELVTERWPDLPIVLTSGYSEALAKDQSNHFLVVQKPYSMDQIDEALRS